MWHWSSIEAEENRNQRVKQKQFKVVHDPQYR